MTLELDSPAFDRVISLSGVTNFRDFGGYRGRSGWLVRKRLFRSGHFSRAIQSDHATLQALELALVVDLRRSSERERYPSRWPESFTAELIAHDDAVDAEAPHETYVELNTAEEAKQAMSDYYADALFVPQHIALFSRAFAALARGGNGASLIHCAAGKDRTGLLVALLHRALGVAQDDIMADYLLTNSVARSTMRLVEASKRVGRSGKPIKEEVLLQLSGVEEAHLDLAFAAAVERYGSLEAYISRGLGVSREQIEAIEERLLV